MIRLMWYVMYHMLVAGLCLLTLGTVFWFYRVVRAYIEYCRMLDSIRLSSHGLSNTHRILTGNKRIIAVYHYHPSQGKTS